LIEYEDAEGDRLGSITWEKSRCSLAIADSATGSWDEFYWLILISVLRSRVSRLYDLSSSENMGAEGFGTKNLGN
jgi:hypothetical protein